MRELGTSSSDLRNLPPETGTSITPSRGMHSTAQPALSIVVPTRNRPQYATECIKHLTEIPDSEVEFVIYDNSTNEDLNEAVKALPGDGRLRYVRDRDQLDVVENFERATRCARGEYITHLGDDDGVSLDIVKCARMARQQQADALVCRSPAFYYWPGHRFYYYGSLYAGALTVRPATGNLRRCRTDVALTRCLKNGGQDFGDLPKSYQGMVSRRALERVLNRCGRYFPGPSPDLAGGAALACCMEQHLEYDYPFIIVGTSSVSTAGLGSRKAHIGKLEEWPHLPRFALENWSEIVPRFFSGRTIWAEDVLQALRACKRSDLIDAFNAEALYGYCLACHPDMRDAILETRRKHVVGRVGGGRMLGMATVLRAYLEYNCRRIVSVGNVLGDVLGGRLIKQLTSIVTAARALQTNVPFQTEKAPAVI